MNILKKKLMKYSHYIFIKFSVNRDFAMLKSLSFTFLQKRQFGLIFIF